MSEILESYSSFLYKISVNLARIQNHRINLFSSTNKLYFFKFNKKSSYQAYSRSFSVKTSEKGQVIPN